MKALIIVMTLFLEATMLCAGTLDDMERSVLIEKLKEQKAQQEEQRQLEAKEQQLKTEEQFRKQQEAARQAEEERKQQQEAARQAEEESKRRYHIEQKERAEYASVMLSKISFDVNSYFYIQKDLKRFVYSASVTEKRWANFKELQSNKDWLGLLNAIVELEMRDYPAQERIEEIIEELKKTRFHAEFLFTHTEDKYQTGISYRMCAGEISLGQQNTPIRWGRRGGPMPMGFNVVWDRDTASLIVPFSMQFGKDKFIHAERSDPSGEELLARRDEQLRKISSDAELGRITQGEAEERRKIVKDELMKGFSAWLNTSKVCEDMYPVRVRRGQAKDARTRSGGKKNAVDSKTTSKPKWTSCPDCGGSRYISKGKCHECGGSGKCRTPVYRGLGGRAMGGQLTNCGMCKGKGEFKELCKSCHGRGKVKQ